MKYKFNPYERAVGLFIGVTILGSLFTFATIMIKHNWFEEEVSFVTYINNGKNVYAGTPIKYKGFHIGEIDEVNFDGGEKIQVTFSLLKKYEQHMTDQTQLKIGMTILGDKSFELIKTDKKGKQLAEFSEIPVIESEDMMNKLQDEMLVKVDGILTSLKVTLDNAANLSNDLQPLIIHATKTLPEGTEKTLTALEETIVVLKAMQKTYFLRGNAEEARAELEKSRLERKPASKKSK